MILLLAQKHLLYIYKNNINAGLFANLQYSLRKVQRYD